MVIFFVPIQINVGLETFVSGFKRLRRSRMEPMIVMFTDLRTYGPTTPLAPLLRAVRRLGLKNALPSALGMDKSLSRILGLADYDPNWKNYDALYLNEEQRKKRPKQVRNH